jgi:hypothetical protein
VAGANLNLCLLGRAAHFGAALLLITGKPFANEFPARRDQTGGATSGDSLDDSLEQSSPHGLILET